MRYIASISALAFIASAAPAFAEGGSTPEKAGTSIGNGSKKAGEAINDSWITGHIKQQFLTDSLVKGRDISVTTAHHDVTLTGTVDSQDAHDRALSIVRNTDGVEKVVDHLELVPSR